MKKLLIMAVAACCLAACNKELGPEYKVAPVISGVTFSPQEVHAGENVHVSATVTSEYGFTGISILYSLNEDPETTEEPKDQVWFGSEKDKSKNYKATDRGAEGRHESDLPDTCRLCVQRVYVLRGVRIYRAGGVRTGADAQPRSELIYHTII